MINIAMFCKKYITSKGNNIFGEITKQKRTEKAGKKTEQNWLYVKKKM